MFDSLHNTLLQIDTTLGKDIVDSLDHFNCFPKIETFLKQSTLQKCIAVDGLFKVDGIGRKGRNEKVGVTVF